MIAITQRFGRTMGAVFAALWLISGCATSPSPAVVPHATPEPGTKPEQNSVDMAISLKQTARDFFAVYARRQDQEALMAYYADDAELRDMVYGNRMSGKQSIAAFYRWDDGSVSLLQPKALKLESLITDGQQVVARGYFTPFMYHQQRLGPWYFVIWLEFNPHGKIIRQTDWINYTPKEQFIDGENLNSLIRP